MEQSTNHIYYGYDVSETTIQNITDGRVSYWENGVNELLSETKLSIVKSISELVEVCEIIFVAVQTPHEANFEGKTPVPDDRKNFNYSYLENVAFELNQAMKANDRTPLVVVISTVLPGTMRNEILPILSRDLKQIRFAYNPFFIAMGTTIMDFLNPEFILIGSDNPEDARLLGEFYEFLGAEKLLMEIESAELTKVAYNTFIGFKIFFANTINEITQKIGGNSDEVTSALANANKRLMSSAYLRSGMGDGGGCHPRDQIAMSWLARELELSADVFDFLARGRDAQTLRQATLIEDSAKSRSLPICILGVAYKADSPLDIGSPARLLEYYLLQKGLDVAVYDPWVMPDSTIPSDPHLFFVGVRHSEFLLLNLPEGSHVIDPWGYVSLANTGSTLEFPGRNFSTQEK
jgi:UDPglucose 6-dehydrogenase